MRTHLLSRLTIPGSEMALALEPQFDFYRATKVTGVEVRFELDSGTSSLRLDLVYEASSRRYRLSLLFEQVSELSLPTMAPALYLPELEIEDVRARMMEGIRFEVISHFDRAFRCACGNLSIISFEPEDE